MDTHKGQFILYQTADGESKIEVTLANETVWLTIDQMAELFQRNKSTISKHIKNVLEGGELQEVRTVAKNAIVQNEEKNIYEESGCCRFCNNHSLNIFHREF